MSDMTWTKDEWVCEDCAKRGSDWGAPDRCPRCGSANVTTDVDSVEQTDETKEPPR